MSLSARSPVTLARVLVAGLLLVLFGTGAALSAAYDAPEAGNGTIESPANGTTYVAVQGFHIQGRGTTKKPARLIAAGPRGGPEEIYNGSDRGVNWFYNVDPLPNGNLLVVNTAPGKTYVYELDPETNERVWERTFDIEDTHDVDRINGDQLLVANMREYENGTSDDRIFVYDLSEDRVVWEWYFKNHYPAGTDGGMNGDWSHVNDVDKVGDGEYLVSPRNFDQVVVVNRSTKEITTRLGADGQHSILYEQHDPQYLESENGTATVLVADSENDRVVEYSCVDRTAGECDWQRVWTVGEGQLNWPRDADRLPNGNTLIVDSLGHRVIEVTPTGDIVWEVYTPWAPFDAERAAYGNEAGGPAMLDRNVSGEYRLSGSAGETPSAGDGVSTFPEWLAATFEGTPLSSPATALAEAWQGVSQWVKPVWMSPWALVYSVAGTLLLFGWTTAEAVAHRRRLARALRRGIERVRDAGRP